MLQNRFIELAARWYVFVFLIQYGVGKLIGGQFYTQARLPPDVAEKTLADATHFELAWTFMGASFYYILFVAVAEIAGAISLLWEKTKLIGVAILLPVMINIIVFDIIFLDQYGALASAVIYFILLIVILIYNKARVQQIWRLLLNFYPSKASSPVKRIGIKTIATAIILMALIFVIDQLLVNLFGHGIG
jgi:hypothetical protein